MPIDTLKASKRLKALGFSEEQAEGLTDLLRDAEAAAATKDDLDALERRMTDRFERLEERLDIQKENTDARFEAQKENTDARFDALEKSINERFARVDERFAQVDDRFDTMEARIDDRFQQSEAMMKNYMTSRIMWAFGLLAVYITLLSYFGG